MANGPDDLPDDLEDVEESGPEEGPVLTPEELDFTKSEYVEKIDEGRFVVSPHENAPRTSKNEPEPPQRDQSHSQDPPEDEHATPQNQPTQSQPQQPNQPQPQPSQSQPQPQNTGQPQPRQPQQSQPAQTQELTQEAVHRWLRQDFEQNGSRYAFDVTATFDGTVSQRRMASNDVVTIFESLMLWYAQQVDSNTPVEEILGILLMESNVPVRYPPESVRNLVKSANLGPDDTIADLLEAIQDDGVQL